MLAMVKGSQLAKAMKWSFHPSEEVFDRLGFSNPKGFNLPDWRQALFI
jgi:hypothetical protein